MPQKKKKHNARSAKKKKSGLASSLNKKIPWWAYWAGAVLVTALYVWFFYYFFVSPYGFRWKALYGGISTPEGFEIHGIDISHHQGKIDWETLRNQGMIDRSPIRFVMIKATEGANRTDPRFEENFSQAKEYGFTRGAYHFYSIHSPAEKQAEYFISKVRLERGDLPPVLDVEHKPAGQSEAEFKKDVLKWLDIVEKHYQVKPIIYTFYKFKMQHLADTVFDQYPYWIAHYYVESIKYKGAWKFWQHTDAGRLPGIKEYVDFNVYNGSYYDLRQLTIGSQETIGSEAYINN